MRFAYTSGPGPAAFQRFLAANGLAAAAVARDRQGDQVIVEIEPGELGDDREGALRAALTRHLSFMDLFLWVENGFEDIAFWDRPGRWPDVVAEVNHFFPPSSYDVLAALEARGFFVAGVLAHALGKPVVPVRKYRAAYASRAGRAVTYRNWRGEDDRLWLEATAATRAMAGRRALVVDDVLETGNSLAACETLLARARIEPVAAMYLIDVAEPAVRGRFGYPIRSLLREHRLRDNTAPALPAGSARGEGPVVLDE